MMTKQKRCTVEIRLRRSVSCGEHLEVGDHKIFFQPFVKTLGVFFKSDNEHAVEQSLSYGLSRRLGNKQSTLASSQTKNRFKKLQRSLTDTSTTLYPLTCQLGLLLIHLPDHSDPILLNSCLLTG